MCRDYSHHLLKYFWYLLVLYINSSVTCLKVPPKWKFSYFQPIFAAIFVTIATVKIESIPNLYTCCSNKLIRTRNIFKKDIRRLSNTYNFNTTKWRNPLILPVFACWKRMFRLKPAKLEVVLCFWSLFCLVLFSLSDMHLNRSKF